MKQTSNNLLLSLLCAALCSCARMTYYEPPATFEPEKPITSIKPRGGQVDWGLALSGGGIRSCAFSIGVLKALYDQGYLRTMDTISAVSGGGYALHWLLEQNDSSRPFGEIVFNDKGWSRRNAELQLAASFAPTGHSLLYTFGHPVWAAKFYQRRIDAFAHNRFGVSEGVPVKNTEYIQGYRSDVQAGRIPYVFFNATINTGEDSRARILEISPEFIGNSQLGYHPWTEPEKSLPTVRVVAISGAAVRDKLAQRLPDYIHGTSQKMTVFDGGGWPPKKYLGDNLGAFSLIRRGIKNVIIVDAEADPKYDFVAYRQLKKLLDAEGIAFSVNDVESFMRSRKEKAKSDLQFTVAPFSPGTATRRKCSGKPEISSKVYYIKLSLPNSIITFDEASKEFVVPGATPDQLCQRNALIRKERFFGGSRLKPELLHKLNGHSMTRGIYAAALSEYANYLNNKDPIKFGKGGFFNYTFPHMTTADQSLYNDQFEALLGLGYLQAHELPSCGN